MLVFFETLLKICFFKAQPQDLPSDRKWTVIATVLIIAATVVAGMNKETSNQILMFALAQVVLYAIMIWLILKLKGFSVRWPQTITALFGTSFLLQLVAIPFASDVPLLQDGQVTINNGLIFIFVISLWSLVIVGYILKNSLESSFFSAFILGFFAQAISLTIALSLVGPVAVDPAL